MMCFLFALVFVVVSWCHIEWCLFFHQMYTSLMWKSWKQSLFIIMRIHIVRFSSILNASIIKSELIWTDGKIHKINIYHRYACRIAFLQQMLLHRDTNVWSPAILLIWDSANFDCDFDVLCIVQRKQTVSTGRWTATICGHDITYKHCELVADACESALCICFCANGNLSQWQDICILPSRTKYTSYSTG